MAGITEHGLEILRQNEVIEELKEQAQPIFQDLVAPDDVVDTSDDSTIGRMIGLYSLPLADLWEAVQQVYLAFDPNSAMGIALDNLVQYGGLIRGTPSASSVTLTVWGDPNTTIFQTASVVRSSLHSFRISRTVVLRATDCIGFKVDVPSTINVGTDYSFEANSPVGTISASHVAVMGDTQQSVINSLFSQLISYDHITSTNVGDGIRVELNNIFSTMFASSFSLNFSKIKARTEAINEQLGPIPTAANTINIIATPVLGWDTVDNPFDATLGEDYETDEELRIRFRNSKFIRATNISDALYSALVALPGVANVAIYDNDSDLYDIDKDIPPHSFRVVVQGGTPFDIAKAIWVNKPLGISSVGNTFETIQDSQGFNKIIYFDRPIEVPIHIEMDITPDQRFPEGGEDQIRAALAQWFGNLSVGEDVVYSRLYTPINSIQGFQVNSLKIGFDDPPTETSNLEIDFNELAVVSYQNINIISP